ncbi:MAG: hypothetical protein PHY47_01160 [Lachnospiraceae bacterium]|nr:hypothetical protein [Lachnospiraceae bacterium]
MTKEKALLILNRLIENLEECYTEEYETALEVSGFWRGEVKEAIKCLEGLKEEHV